MLVIEKPHNQLSVPSRIPKSLPSVYSQLQEAYPEVRCVHRLDYETSGLMVFARGKLAERHLFEQFRDRTVKKTYTAVCLNPPEADSGVINIPICPPAPGEKRSRIDRVNGKPSETHWFKGGQNPNQWLAVLKPITGRTHQLRIHLSHMGCAIQGDPLYSQNSDEFDRLYLHASTLQFKHPFTSEPLHFESDPGFSVTPNIV